MFRLKLKDSLKRLKYREIAWKENFARKIYIISKTLHIIIQLGFLLYIYQYLCEGSLEFLSGGCISLFLQLITLGFAWFEYNNELFRVIYVEKVILACLFLEYTVETIFTARKYYQREEQEKLYYAYQPNDSYYLETTSIKSPMVESTINPSESTLDSVIMKALNLTLSIIYLDESEQSEKIDNFINGFNKTISNPNLGEETTNIFDDFTANFIVLYLVLPFFINVITQIIIISILLYHRIINHKKRVAMKDNQASSNTQHIHIGLKTSKNEPRNFQLSSNLSADQSVIEVKDGVKGSKSSSDKLEQEENK